MDLPFGVLGIYAAFAAWIIILIRDLKRGSYRPFILFGIALMLILNLRYLVEGNPSAIAFFIGIYDVFDNLGLSNAENAAALATCPDNACSVWGERYTHHPSWGVAFHDRFLNGSDFRNALLTLHLSLNCIVFVLMHIQLWKPGFGKHKRSHALLGRVSFACLTVGTVCAIWLAAEHGDVSEYGGALSMLGFWSMSLCVYGCAVMGVLAIRQGDQSAHRIWMIRFMGSMWGAFWLFRAMLLVTGPLFREWESVSLLLSIWFSAPLGVVIAEVFRQRHLRLSSTTVAGAT